jgi:hypothetical protein
MFIIARRVRHDAWVGEKMSQSMGLSRAHQEPASPARGAGRALVASRAALARLRKGPIPSWHRTIHPAPAPLLTERQELRPEEIRFRRLTSAQDIECVLPLRREINLPRAGDPGFAMLEKKEMSAALSAHSSGADKSSAPSVSFPWVAGLRLARKSSPGRSCRLSFSPTGGK